MNTVSKADGGTFDGAVTLAGGVSGNIANVSGDMTIDVAGDITLDADGGDVKLSDDQWRRIGMENYQVYCQVVVSSWLIETAADAQTNLVLNTANTSLNGMREGRRTGRSGAEDLRRLMCK